MAIALSASPVKPTHAARRVIDFLKRDAKKVLEARAFHLPGSSGCAEAYHRARYREPLGLLFDAALAVVLVAADPRASIRARLCGRARSCAHARDESRAALLAVGGRADRRCRAAADLAAGKRLRAAPLYAPADSRRDPAAEDNSSPLIRSLFSTLQRRAFARARSAPRCARILVGVEPWHVHRDTGALLRTHCRWQRRVLPCRLRRARATVTICDRRQREPPRDQPVHLRRRLRLEGRSRQR